MPEGRKGASDASIIGLPRLLCLWDVDLEFLDEREKTQLVDYHGQGVAMHDSFMAAEDGGLTNRAAD